MKEPIQLREKKLKDGSISLYLDYYHDGVREYKTLRMYLKPGNDRITKEMNRRTYEAAKAIQAAEIVKVNEGHAGLKRASNILMTDYIQKLASTKKKSTAGGYATALYWWRKVFGNDVRVSAVTPEMLVKFSHELQAGLNGISPRCTYVKIGTVIKTAYKEGLILSDPTVKVAAADRPGNKTKEDRVFLTAEELKTLISTPCKCDQTKRAFLFSCFTGLRSSDIRTLKWSDMSDGYIVKSMVKTGRSVRIPLTDNALKWLPEKKAEDGLVFHLMTPAGVMHQLKVWTQKAGIKKHVTFHTARHTFATMLITYGADIYTVSKLVGHTSVKTTEIYAKIIDKKKEEAVNNLPTF